MRFICLILVMMMISTSSQSSEMKDWTKCRQTLTSINEYLGIHSVDWHMLKKLELGSDLYMQQLDAIDRSLTKASKYATIYNAKCK